MIAEKIIKSKQFINETQGMIITDDIKKQINLELNPYIEEIKKIQNIPKFVGIFVRNKLNEYYNRIIYNNSFGNKRTLEKNINLYGLEEGTRRWEDYKSRQSYTNSKEYKNMTDEEFKTYNDSRAVTLNNQIKKYGLEEGTRRWEDYKSRQSYTNSKEYFIEKLGEIEGTSKYYEVNKKKSLSYDNFIEKYGLEEGTIKWDSFVMNSSSTFYSKISQEFIKIVDDKIKETHNIKSYYATLNNEFGKYSHTHSKYFKYDYVIIYNDKKICIEFNGDDWHCNPKKYTSKCTQKMGKKQQAMDVWNYDNIKNDTIISDGFELFIIWESDYKSNKNNVVDKTIEIIKERLQ